MLNFSGGAFTFTFKQTILFAYLAWLPKESFGIKVQIKRSEIDKVTGCVVLIDTLAGTRLFTKGRFRVRLYLGRESESDIATRWVHRESNLKFTFISDKAYRKIRFCVRLPSSQMNLYTKCQSEIFFRVNSHTYLAK